MNDSKKYIGIIERNQWERETFGYYFPIEAAEAIKGLFNHYVKNGKTQEAQSLRLEESVSHETLVSLDKHDRNGYSSRVKVFACDDWDAYTDRLKKTDPEVNPIYKGFPADEIECRTDKVWDL